jgi:hypothetical protein
MSMKKTIILISLLTLCAVSLLAMAIIGYADWQVISTPGNPASGYIRTWADSSSGLVKCITSAGADCYFSVSVPASATALASNASSQIIAAMYQGNGAKVQLSTGSTSANDCVKFDANGNVVDSGSACSSGGSGTTIWTGTASPNGGLVSPTNMTANKAPSPYVASGSSFAGSGYEYSQSFAPAATTEWLSNATNTGFLQIDLGAGNASTCGTYAIYVNVTSNGQFPKNWTFQGSNDNSTWTTLDTETGVTTWTQTTTYTFACTTSSTYRYFRINVTLNNGSSYVGLGKVFINARQFTSGVAGDFYYQTSTGQFYGPRPSGGSPVWPLASVFQVGGVVSTGARFTASGCSVTNLVGGSSAGSFSSGTSGTCTPVITMGIGAPNGWACAVNDLTTPADVIHQTATTANTATFSGTTVSADVIAFHCIGY